MLGKETLPFLNETMTVFRGEETQRGVILEPNPKESLALITQSKGRRPDSFRGVGGGSETATGDKDSL